MTRRRTHRTEAGAAMVELPLVFVAFVMFAMCFLALGQLFLDYHHLSGAARAAARYATKSDPRHPDPAAVQSFAQQSAAPLSGVTVTMAPDTTAGNGVDVVVSAPVRGGAYGLVTGMANSLLSMAGQKPLKTFTLHAHAVAIYE